ncbi:Mannose-6-phosphate isomerase, cupin superfamily [Rhizobiales bacterium GAS188]|jgi:mannose-6-phosphate isomerase-like protein (cupin superfamily)|nr:Mannose-6-phosphate isomerase, cupin superfamily [Rhizobiales bacterium GAS188]
MGHLIDRKDWAADPDRWRGEWQGAAYGAGVSVIFVSEQEVGAGPKLHRHPYAETFMVRLGRALFTIGDDEIQAHEGQMLVVPANTPHKFSNLGPGLLETIDIHANDRFVTEWLE